MLSHADQIFSQTIQQLYTQSKWAVVLLLLALCVSCSSAKPPDIALQLNVQAANPPGSYNISGTTNLPNQSQITVGAIRYLSPANQEFFGTDSKGIYSILDRQIVRVDQGKWQAALNLWQVSPDGRLQEAWQQGLSKTELSLHPSTEVSFVANFDPTGQFLKPPQQLRNQDLKGSLIRFSSEGVPYVQASQTLQVNLPTGRRTPPPVKAEDINGGWGKRYELLPQPLVPNRISTQQFQTNQTNAPLSPAEFLR